MPKSDSELLKGNTPTLVLAVLRDAPLHGYAIAREVERRSENAFRFKEGTLYPALHILETEGFITGTWEQGPGGRQRKVYCITPEGLAELDRRGRAWRAFATAVQNVLGGEDHGPSQSIPIVGRPVVEPSR